MKWTQRLTYSHYVTLGDPLSLWVLGLCRRSDRKLFQGRSRLETIKNNSIIYHPSRNDSKFCLPLALAHRLGWVSLVALVSTKILQELGPVICMENSELTYSQQYSMFFLNGFFYLTFSGMRDELYFFLYFLKDFFKCGPFLKSLLNLLQYCYCSVFSFLATRHVGSELPDQGLNLCRLLWKVKS